MTDRELLEMAAKVAGISGKYVEGFGSGDWYYSGNQDGIYHELSDGGYEVWNPLTDDGDALRLAVELGISIDMEDKSAWRRNGNRLIQEYWVGDYDPRFRRAIVRAAAEIGRAMP